MVLTISINEAWLSDINPNYLTTTDNCPDGDQSEIHAIMNGITADNDESNGSASELAENYYSNYYNTSSSSKGGSSLSPFKSQQRSSGKAGRSGGKGGFRSAGSGGSGGAGAKKTASQVDPDVIMLGRDALDRELRCLYQPRPNGSLRLAPLCSCFIMFHSYLTLKSA